MGCVRAYDRESMKSISLGSHNLTKLDRTSSSICVRFFSWNMTYGSGTTLHITGELAFLDFWKQLQISSITRTNLYHFIFHIYTQQLRLGSSICNPRNFQVHWQGIYITSRFKLKRTPISKLSTTDMVEQSKTHPFNFHKELKHSYLAWWKGK